MNNSKEKAVMDGSMKEFVDKKKGSTVIRLLSYFRYYKGLAVLAVLLALLVNVASIAQPYILKTIIDNYLTKGIYEFNIFLSFGLLYLFTVTVGAAGNYGQTVVLTFLGQSIIHKIRTKLFSHIQNLGMRFFDKNSSGKILTRINSDVETLSDIYSSTLIVIVRDTLLIVGILTAMFSMSKTLALWSLWSIPAVAALTVLYRYLARENFKKVKAQLSKINSFLAENIIGMKVVQIFAREDNTLEEFHNLGNAYCKLGVRAIVLNSLSNPLILAISNVMIAILIGSFASQVKQGIIEVGVIIAFTTYIKQLFNPIAKIAEQFTGIQSSLISADRVFDIMDTVDCLEDFSSGIRVNNIKGDIEFKNVWFAYNDEDFVLKDVSFIVKSGQRCAFVGPTGSGKSTIISLLVRFYDIQSGQILVDGIDIKEYNLGDLRRCIAVVMQDVFLFSGDIRFNIRLNNEDISDYDIAKTIEAINADEFFDSFEDGYDHKVSERGSTFSAGERQLVSFARAVAFKPSVLVLDEATANIDTETEVALQRSIDATSGKQTVIIIAHRLSTIVNSDIIFVMKKGKIKETGSHQELYHKNGLYKKLYDMSCKSVL